MATNPGSNSNFRILATIVIAAAFLAGMLFDRWLGGSQSNAVSARSSAASAPKTVLPPGQAVLGFLNMVDGKPLISASPRADIHVSGWAACVNPDSPLVTVEVLVDNEVKGHSSSTYSRPDVVKAYGRPDFERSGWAAAFSPGDIAAGMHQLTAHAVCKGGESGDLPPFQLSMAAE